MSKKKQTGQEEISERVSEIGRVSLPNCATSLTHHQAAQLVFNEALQIVTRENELTQSDRTVEKSVGLFLEKFSLHLRFQHRILQWPEVAFSWEIPSHEKIKMPGIINHII